MGDLRIEPLTAERWPDLLDLFGPRGASSGCWCMWVRARPSEYARGNDSNRAAFSALAGTGEPLGLLAYRDGVPVGWASVSPREQLLRVVGDPETAETESAHEPGPVWALPCFYIRTGQRGSGIATALLDAAIGYARGAGAAVLEAYPLEPVGRASNASAWTGFRSMFARAGFEEVGRFDRWRTVPGLTGPSPVRPRTPPGRPVMRLRLTGGPDEAGPTGSGSAAGR